MNTARIVVLSIALVAGGVAAFLASGSDPTPPPAAPAAPVEQKPTDDVLVARKNIPLGFSVTEEDLQWQDWPNASSGTFIRRADQPDAMKKYIGYIVRSPFVAGEPIRDTKLVEGKGSGFMAAILPVGMRAVSVEISPETGAGGFILPNDRVDVLMSRREKTEQGNENIISEIILSDIRVLAIDQQVEEKNGLKVVVGKTATLEVKPEQFETLGRARQGGTLSLALRSMRQEREVQAEQTETENRVTVFRGSAERESLNCNPRCERRGK